MARTLSSGLATATDVPNDDGTLAQLASGQREWESGDPIEVVRIPLSPGAQYNHYWRLGESRDIDTPASRFDDCYPLFEWVGHEYSTHWLCPGVGFVRHAMGGGNSAGGYFTVFELIDHYNPLAP
jgi:hypothetical protein